MKWRKKILWALVLLVAAGLLAWALMPAPVPVSTTEVRSGSFVESVEEEGRTRLRDTFTVSAPIAGYLQRVALEAGDPVDLGQVVFRMEPLPAPALDARSLEQARENLSAARARFETARANLETEQAEAQFAESEFQRYRQLRERELVSATEMERARSARDRQRAAARAAEHSVEVARSEVESARAVLDIASGTRPDDDQPLLEVRSPSAGVVLTRHRCCEGAIHAGEPVLEIGDLADLEIQVDLLSMDAVRVRSGMPVRIGGWGGDELLHGQVRRVEPAGFTRVSALGVDEQRVPVIVDFADVQQATERLGVGFRVDAEFVLWEGEDVIQVPTSALFRVDGQWAVFVVAEGRARERLVQPGRRSGMISQIVDGLSPGEVVVTHPGDRVRDGVRVQPQTSR
ncbi:efflux RND transporter periplasmic adaptor subunit [Thioalkalivibrio paradoxus]|uniref:RND transporter n=1 Tax=Thioalkalivibrio paradoxus ARh 1 TaxID=713585 RepID=W0DKX7_9GAMM|nr:HlyD family efflux transporter periplasmic adaptor subunit [Thioalkalivibrio paradoxus]AHE99111.1 RND transporter [Thioalkalivibrio paradoxus ARh 1]